MRNWEQYQQLKTPRLHLRPWQQSDAADLLTLASDPRVGPVAGWPVHTDEQMSRDVITNVLAAPFTYAITDRKQGSLLGAINLMFDQKGTRRFDADEAEIGFWLGVPYWGHGYMSEALQAILLLAFDELELATLWCGYYDGNFRSEKVQTRNGFVYETSELVLCDLLHETRLEHFQKLTRENWQKRGHLS